MEVNTPKKLVNGDLRCYLCNRTPLVKERIKIFGKTAHDLPKLINSALSIDVNIYSANDLFVCTNPCYKRLLKLEKLEKNITDLKTELRSSFDCNVESARVKRLRKDSGTVSASTSKSSTTANYGASKSLYFAPQAPTTCTSFSYTPTEALQKPYHLVYNAFGHLQAPAIAAESQLSSFLPLLTSTPLAKPAKTTVRNETKVKVSVEYPSKPANKTLEPCYEALGKALVHGPPERIARAVVKCEPVFNIVIKHVLHKVLTEVNGLCSRKNPSILRKAGKEDLKYFSMQSMCQEWKERAPIFYAFLMTVALSNGTKDASWLPSVAVAGSILLKQRSRHMNATAAFLAILFKTTSTEVSLKTLLV